jgi:hypothetical protein
MVHVDALHGELITYITELAGKFVDRYIPADPSPHYSRLMVRGAVAAIPDTPATPMPLSRSLTTAARPHVLCWERFGGRRMS